MITFLLQSANMMAHYKSFVKLLQTLSYKSARFTDKMVLLVYSGLRLYNFGTPEMHKPAERKVN